MRLGEEVQTLERFNQNGEELLAIGTDKGGPYLSRALIITAGHGAFEPRKLGIEGIDEWEGRASTTSCARRRSSATGPA